MSLRLRGALVLIYLIVGIWVAYQNDYLAESLIKPLLSVLLAVFLWFLIPLGVNLHLR